jgi:2-polyprenyl-3-methyl-5-hydroxy-6-metoxy-1,4-benzoquinol methylase
MTLPPYLYPDLLAENLYGHRYKVENLRKSIDGLRNPDRPNLRILDAGCGSGYAVTRFLPRKGDQVVGLDMFEPSIEYAQKNYGREELTFVCAIIDTLPESYGQYDVVVLADVLEHLDNPLAVLKSAVARLAPGGLLLASIPNGRGPFEIESAISRIPIIGSFLLRVTDISVAILNKTILRGLWSRHMTAMPTDLPYNIESGHLQFFTLRQFTDILHQAGLTPRAQKSLSFLCGPFTNYWLAPSHSFSAWNIKIAGKLPMWAVSGWFFECARSKEDTLKT